MARIAFTVPCVPGGADKLREMAEQLRGPRREEFEYFHSRVGLISENWYLQQTPQGEIYIVVLEGDPEGAMRKLAASDHPFDQWFKELARDVHGSG